MIGEIWYINLNNSIGYEQNKIRPSIIVTKPHPKIYIVVPLTSNKKALRFKHTTIVKSDQNTNLKTNSIALLFQLRAIDKRRKIKLVGKIDPQNKIKLQKKLFHMFNN